MSSHLSAVTDHRRLRLQPTVHIAQVSYSIPFFIYLFFVNKCFSATVSCVDKPTHQCQSAACNEQCWRNRKRSQTSLLVNGSYFLTILPLYIQFNRT